MKIEIEISENDFKAIQKTVMPISEMESTLTGRIYTAITKGYLKQDILYLQKVVTDMHETP